MTAPSESALERYHRGYGERPAGLEPAHTGISPGAVLALVLLVAAVVLGALAHLVHVPKVVYLPGPVYDTLGEVDGEPVVDVEGLATYPTSGALDFTTIKLEGGPGYPLTAWEWLTAELDPSLTVVDRARVFPEDVTAEQVKEQNVELMEESQQGAAVVALRAVGVEVPEEIKVAQVIVDAPAEDVLQVDDQILTVAGTEIMTGDDVRDRLQDFEPGESVPFTIVRDGEEVEVQVPTGESEVVLEEGGSERRTVIGVYLASDFDLPHEVTIDSGNVGGSSAGLMFSLAVYDKVTPGELTGGEEIAGTGTINSVGEVGSIGGIKQKMIGARQSGSDYFLAPAANCAEVVDNVPRGLIVAAVDTFQEARQAVADIAAGDLEELPRCA